MLSLKHNQITAFSNYSFIFQLVHTTDTPLQWSLLDLTNRTLYLGEAVLTRWYLLALLRWWLLTSSFSVVINIWGAARLLNWLARVIFAIAATDVWQLIRVCLPMHRVWETLSVARLIHRGPRATARHSTDAADAHRDASNWSLLNASSLWSDHINAIVVVGICTGYTDRRAA